MRWMGLFFCFFLKEVIVWKIVPHLLPVTTVQNNTEKALKVRNLWETFIIHVFFAFFLFGKKPIRHLINSFVNTFSFFQLETKTTFYKQCWTYNVSIQKIEGGASNLRLIKCCFTTISSQIFAIYIHIFHKTEVQTVILRCLFNRSKL